MEEKLGYNFKDLELLKTALTHPSFKNEHPEIKEDNQRLEFLGDAVIEITVCHAVYLKFTQWDEGGMTLLKSRIVNTENLAKWGMELELSKRLIMGRGEAKTGGAFRQGNLADTFEAVIGAIFLDGGMDAAKAVLTPMVNSFMQGIITIEDLKDPKTLLQEKTLAVVKKAPDYREITSDNKEGAIHSVEVVLCGHVLATGTGKNKREASRDAAKKALDELKNYAPGHLGSFCD